MYNIPYGREDIDINITNQNTNTNMNEIMNTNIMPPIIEQPMMPIIEPGRERIINRTFIHNVPHICPINTRIINNHVYKHTYTPKYTCCEENHVCNEQCPIPSPCNTPCNQMPF